MKVLVTGATGFLGSYVIPVLIAKGHQVIASSGSEEKAMTAPWYSQVSYHSLDLSALDATKNYFDYFERPDAMIHLAWEGLPRYKEDFHLETNLPRHILFLNNLVVHGLRNLTVAGTCLEYGLQEGMLREDQPVFPDNAYAKAKNQLRQYLQELSSVHPFALKWARLFYLYGKGQNPNSLLSQLESALEKGQASFNMSGGEQVRDFLPVEKMARYLVEISLQDEVTGIINCCSGKPVTVLELVQNYLAQRQKNIELNLGYYSYPDYEPMRFWGDTTKLKTIVRDE
jgi:nucleoside-diphosphate-sugar epimerase